MFQLHLDFDIKALEALVTSEGVTVAVAKVEKEIVATQEEANAMGAERVDMKVVVREAIDTKTTKAVTKETVVVEVLEEEA